MEWVDLYAILMRLYYSLSGSLSSVFAILSNELTFFGLKFSYLELFLGSGLTLFLTKKILSRVFSLR